MSLLAAVDLLPFVPPGTPMPESAVLFTLPTLAVWLVAAGLGAAIAILGRRMTRAVLAWWRRRVRRRGPRVAPRSLGAPGL